MNLKKIAVRGLIAVAVLVALCMFFSGTIENITTPKVKFARGSYGKLVENVELEANLAYPDTVEQRLNLPAGQSLTITRVNVRAGYPVKAGDVVIEATVTGYDAAAEQAQSAYDDAIDALMEVERKNEGLSLRRSDQNYADSYAALRSATREAARRRTDMEVLLRAEKLSAVDEGYPEGASDELKAAIDAYRAPRFPRRTRRRTPSTAPRATAWRTTDGPTSPSGRARRRRRTIAPKSWWSWRSSTAAPPRFARRTTA